MTLLDEAIQLIKKHEGFSSEPYLCPGEVWTIGYGHTQGITSYTYPISEDQAELLLRDDIAAVEKIIRTYVSVPLTSEQYSALVSFVFNIGEGNFRRSTLLRKLNAEDYTGAAGEFPRWIYAAGRRLKGLEKRRREERDLFLRNRSSGVP